MFPDQTADPRLDELRLWLASALRLSGFTIEPASADASFRRYFRVTLAAPCELAPTAPTLIAMDAPPAQEDCRPFVHVAKLLDAAGVNAPRVLATDLDRGFLLLTDLGTTTYASALDDASAHALYLDAIDALIRWQGATREGELPPYDEALLRRELMLFPEWYVGRHLGHAPTPAERATLDTVFGTLIASALAQPRVYVHRDYHSRNLMVCTPNPGVLDFQDAVQGPITYDLVSLLRDAYVEWDEERELDWAIRYWERARKAGLPVAAGFAPFWRDYEWMGVQRQLKVLGIFARLSHRDGKHRYVSDMPRVLRYLRRACARYREFDALSRILDLLEGRSPAFVHPS
ncbi:MAG TPA: phosphotransferase [Casimicrobiaceae bacterium]|nr:phosphotransferase [Casimicrobiaceae bacterium]